MTSDQLAELAAFITPLQAEIMLQEHYNELKPESAYKLAMAATDDKAFADRVLDDLVQRRMDDMVGD